MRDRRWVLVAATAYVALYAVLLHVHAHIAPLVLYSTSLALFAVLIVILRRVEASRHWTTTVILGVAVLLQVVAWTAAPTTSDDVNRYVWDGRVQFAGVDPYSYAPSSPALTTLRDHALFPGGACPHPFAGGCTLINRPDVHTVYPPAAQLVFDAVHLVSFGGHGGPRPFQLLAGVGVIAVTLLLLRWRRDTPVWSVALWAWSPLVVLEYGNNAHIDWLAVIVSLAALLASRRGRAAASGVLIAVATLMKLYPVLIAPALLRRRPKVVAIAALATGMLLYLPHVAARGAGVIGYLPGYLHEEGYSSGSRLLLLGTVLPHPYDTVVGIAILTVVAWWAFHHTDPDAPEKTAIVLVGAAFLVTTPTYGWYAGLLLALCVAARRYEWVPVAMAPGLSYVIREDAASSHAVATVVYGAAAVTTAALCCYRRLRLRPILFAHLSSVRPAMLRPSRALGGLTSEHATVRVARPAVPKRSG